MKEETGGLQDGKKGQRAEHQNKDGRGKIDHALMHKVGAIGHNGTRQRPASKIRSEVWSGQALTRFSMLKAVPGICSWWKSSGRHTLRARWGLQVHSLVPGWKLQQ